MSTKFYKIKKPKYKLAEAKRRDATYSVRIYIIAQLKVRSEISEAEVFLGDIPLMIYADLPEPVLREKLVLGISFPSCSSDLRTTTP